MLTILLLSTAAHAEDADPLLQHADLYRAPLGSFEMHVSITDFEAGERVRTTVARVLDNTESTLIILLEPARDAGKSLLGRGTDLWIYLPDVRKPVRIPFSQRLTGQIANGDLARLRFEQDYLVTEAKDDATDGRATKRLELKAKRPEATYGQITLWLSAEDDRPLKAEYHALSGQLLKVGQFGDYVDDAGHPRCTLLTITDAVRTNRNSVMRFERVVRKDFPASLFTKESMAHLE
jgi:outer membrane lipoprotein-sorting protein